eukprot:3960987-Alexandrium_andersonii.AAC.1
MGGGRRLGDGRPGAPRQSARVRVSVPCLASPLASTDEVTGRLPRGGRGGSQFCACRTAVPGRLVSAARAWAFFA